MTSEYQELEFCEVCQRDAPSKHKCDEKPERDVFGEMVERFKEEFNEEPNHVWSTVIRSSVKRVMNGETYKWVEDQGEKRLVWE